METDIGLFVGSIAMIRRFEDEKVLWLTRWHHTCQRLRLIRAPRLEHESWRECLDREIAWALQLRRGRDYIISRVPRLHFDTILEQPHNCRYVTEFYVVDLYGRNGRTQACQDELNCWLSSDALLSGTSPDGRRIDEVDVELLNRSRILDDRY
jgi:hypothetical protein